VRDEAYYARTKPCWAKTNVRLGRQRTPVEWVEGEELFLKLSPYQDRLLALYASQPLHRDDSRKMKW